MEAGCDPNGRPNIWSPDTHRQIIFRTQIPSWGGVKSKFIRKPSGKWLGKAPSPFMDDAGGRLLLDLIREGSDFHLVLDFHVYFQLVSLDWFDLKAARPERARRSLQDWQCLSLACSCVFAPWQLISALRTVARMRKR